MHFKSKNLCLSASQDGMDVIHCHDIETLPCGIWLKKTSGALLVWDAHEIYEELAGIDLQLRKRYQRILSRSLREIDFFITINDSFSTWYKNNYPALPGAVIIKNATHIATDIAYDGRLHVAADLPREQKIALYQGGFQKNRGLISLVESANFLNPEWTLVLMGWGKMEDELKAIGSEIIANSSLRPLPSIVFLPPAPQSELVYWTAGATVGLIPYENTGLNHLYCTPNKLWEFPAAGVPILCSNLVELSKAVNENCIGWILPEIFEPETIADFINKLSSEEIVRAKRNCCDYIQKDNWSIYGERLVNMYQELPVYQGRHL
jgi:glycosyltransferase involved in cell wall biosynthesis